MASLIGTICAILIGISATIYSFNVRENHPERYRGLWRYIGTMAQTPKKAMFYWGMFLVGMAIAMFATSILNIILMRSHLLLTDTILGILLVIAITFPLVAYRLHRRNL